MTNEDTCDRGDWSTQLGYRYMDISKEIDGRKVSVDLGGPVLAVSYKF